MPPIHRMNAATISMKRVNRSLFKSAGLRFGRDFLAGTFFIAFKLRIYVRSFFELVVSRRACLSPVGLLTGETMAVLTTLFDGLSDPLTSSTALIMVRCA